MENKNTATKTSLKPQKMSRKSYKIFNTVIIILSIVIFAGVNILANVLVEKNPTLAKDWTKGSYGLNKITEEYFEYLDTDVTIKVLMEEERLIAMETDYGYGYQVNRLLKEMSGFDNVTLEYENIVSTPVKLLSEKYPDIDWGSPDNLLLITDNETGKYKVASVYQVFAHYQDESSGEYVIYGQSVEATVLTAIQHITSDKVVKVGLSVGNGEFFNKKNVNYGVCSYLPVFLDDNAYKTEEINLLTETPAEDMEVIIMMAPSTDLTPEAVDVLSQWLRNDGDYGRTLFYVPSDQTIELTNLELLLEQWGMKVTEGNIRENASDRTASLGESKGDKFPLMEYFDTTYTKDIRTDLKVLMPECVPVEIIDENAARPLLVTSDKAEIITASGKYSTGEALNGAAIGVKSGDDEKKSAVIVWGSLYALKDTLTAGSYAPNINNVTYFINLLNNFSAKTGDTILVVSAELDGIHLPIKSSQQVTVGILFIFVIPIAIIVYGIVVWARRRHR